MPHVERTRWAVLALTGNDLAPYKERVVSRGVRARAVHTGFDSEDRYLEALEAGDDWARSEALRLTSVLCPKVSGFFRDPGAFSALEELAYPALFRRTSRSAVRVWCAACSRGQEAYSLAVSLRRWARRLGEPVPFSVLGTDVDEDALAAARDGVYRVREIEGGPRWLLEEAFEPLPGGHLRVRREIRDRVRFQRRDVLSFETHSPRFDLISCRNLLIYLRRPVQEALILRFRSALSPGGFLLLGVTETVLGRPWKSFDHVSPRWRIYRRPEDAGV